MNYYERYPGDYQRDTASLSLAEHGAYTMLLDTYYSTESPLPADLAALYRICRAMNKGEQAAVRAVADQFFPIAEDGLRHNGRADQEIAKAKPRMDASRANGKKGGRPRKENPEITRQVSDEKPSGFSLGNPAETQPGIPHTPYTIPQGSNQPCAVGECSTPNSASAHAPPAAGEIQALASRTAEINANAKFPMRRDWSPPPDALSAVCLATGTPPHLITPSLIAEFREYWAEESAVFTERQWISKLCGRAKRHAANPGGTLHANHKPAPRKPVGERLREQAAAVIQRIDREESHRETRGAVVDQDGRPVWPEVDREIG